MEQIITHIEAAFIQRTQHGDGSFQNLGCIFGVPRSVLAPWGPGPEQPRETLGTVWRKRACAPPPPPPLQPGGHGPRWPLQRPEPGVRMEVPSYRRLANRRLPGKRTASFPKGLQKQTRCSLSDADWTQVTGHEGQGSSRAVPVTQADGAAGPLRARSLVSGPAFGRPSPSAWFPEQTGQRPPRSAGGGAPVAAQSGDSELFAWGVQLASMFQPLCPFK